MKTTKHVLLALMLASATPALALLSSTTTRSSFVANGSSAAFTFTFPASDPSTVQVQLNGTVQSYGYAVALNADQTNSPGGTVTFTAAPPPSYAVVIQRVVPLTQGTHFAPYSAFPASTMENSLDQVVRQVQQVDRDRLDLATKEATDFSNALSGGSGLSDSVQITATGTTNPRTVADRFGDMKSVKDCQAQGNGVADDGPAINQCVAALSAGGTLYFPPGTYLLKSQQIALASNIKYVGAGRGSTTILLDHNGSFYPSGFSNWNGTVSSATAHNIAISDLTIDGQYASVSDNDSDDYQIGIFLVPVAGPVNTNITIERVEFKNIWYVGVEIFSGNSGVTVRNCSFDHVGDKNTRVGGFYYGVGIDNGGTDIVVDGNTFTNSGSGVNNFSDAIASDGISVTNNHFRNLKNEAYNGRQGVTHLTIAHNIVSGVGLQAFFLDDNPNFNNSHTGGNSANVKVANNIIDNWNTSSTSGGYAIDMTAASGLSVENNTLVGGSTGSSTGGIVVRNALASPDGTTGPSAGYTAVSPRVMGNFVEGTFPGQYGIRILGGATVEASRNTINGDTTGVGIRIDSGVTGARVAQNVHLANATDISDLGTGSVVEGHNVNFTPAWTGASTNPVLGNGSIREVYSRLGGSIRVELEVTIGSSTTLGTGAWLFSVPFALGPSEPNIGALAYGVGECTLIHTGTSDWTGQARLTGSSLKIYYTSAATTTTGAVVTGSAPFSWASGDQLHCSISYSL